jgi:ribosomal protein S18 acetylase RimI-like enzyme
MSIAIEPLTAAAMTDRDAAELAALLLDAIDSGATVSFLANLTQADADAWWREVIRQSDPRGALLVARDAGRIVGSVHLQPAWAPNQRHRGTIVKLLVLRAARRRGIARALMRAIEAHAQRSGFTLLMLNTQKGGAAESLYRSLGWTAIGEVPRYALDPSGVPGDTVLFYKEL